MDNSQRVHTYFCIKMIESLSAISGTAELILHKAYKVALNFEIQLI